ncbi:MAG: isoprenyl transferase [Gammaproteobacteria bacterium]|nr:isoprenyl transferase [Gammaproteobacteria bacterium]NNC76869.1 isoprenyl transferase [Woeseiaceae bacterium]
MQSPPIDTVGIPRHIAIIMDGNGRWARKRAMPRTAGHRAGVKSVRATVEHAGRLGIEHLTLFAFSSENWNRPADEVSRLMSLFVEALQREVAELHRNKVRLEFIGDRSQLGEGLNQKIAAAEEQTANNDGLHLIVAVAYGGRWDITEAARRVCGRVMNGTLRPDEVSEDDLAQALQLGGVPDPDLLIRTGGEKRISNFLLWNLAYAEFWFCDVLWPDFRAEDFDQALAHFSHCQRRYGKTGEQLETMKC